MRNPHLHMLSHCPNATGAGLSPSMPTLELSHATAGGETLRRWRGDCFAGDWETAAPETLAVGGNGLRLLAVGSWDLALKKGRSKRGGKMG